MLEVTAPYNQYSGSRKHIVFHVAVDTTAPYPSKRFYIADLLAIDIALSTFSKAFDRCKCDGCINLMASNKGSHTSSLNE